MISSRWVEEMCCLTHNTTQSGGKLHKYQDSFMQHIDVSQPHKGGTLEIPRSFPHQCSCELLSYDLQVFRSLVRSFQILKICEDKVNLCVSSGNLSNFELVKCHDAIIRNSCLVGDNWAIIYGLSLCKLYVANGIFLVAEKSPFFVQQFYDDAYFLTRCEHHILVFQCIVFFLFFLLELHIVILVRIYIRRDITTIRCKIIFVEVRVYRPIL